MGHHVIAVIGRSGVTDRFRKEHGLKSAALVDGWRLVPLEDEDLDILQLDSSQTLPGYECLSLDLKTLLSEISTEGDLVYLETEYFGGLGGQRAVTFSSGNEPVMGEGEDAINKALAYLGFSAMAGNDEFGSIGLPRLRHTSDWKELAEEESRVG